jgi:hypothetical protein
MNGFSGDVDRLNDGLDTPHVPGLGRMLNPNAPEANARAAAGRGAAE